jgi:BASS family bile acid:Na+ symporter
MSAIHSTSVGGRPGALGGSCLLGCLAQGYHAVLGRTSRFMREWLLWLLLGVYALAAFLPASLVWGKEVEFGEITVLGETSRVTLSMVLLSVLLFNAGLDIPLAQLRRLLRQPAMLLLGLAANLLVPVVYICGLGQVLGAFAGPDSVCLVVLGLALIASMPIAGSSAAWAQNANANLALSLGLILASTVLSPLTTPVLLRSVGWVLGEGHAEGLNALADSGMTTFMTIFVLGPSVVGVAVRWLVGDGPVGRVLPSLRLLNSFLLLLLNYSNASVSLPGVVAAPDWNFLALAALASLGMCVLAFAAGWLLANVLHADEPQRMSLMFGLGLNISSPGLVLASVTLSHMPGVMLPAILYTLVQHVVAGVVSLLMRLPKAAPATRQLGNCSQGQLAVAMHPARRPSLAAGMAS